MPGEFVFYQGDYGDKFYIILKGEVQVLVHNTDKKSEGAEPSPSKKKGKGLTTGAASQGMKGKKQESFVKPTLIIRGDEDERSASRKSDDERSKERNVRNSSTEPANPGVLSYQKTQKMNPSSTSYNRNATSLGLGEGVVGKSIDPSRPNNQSNNSGLEVPNLNLREKQESSPMRLAEGRDQSIIIIDQEDDDNTFDDQSISGDGDRRKPSYLCRHDAAFYKKYSELNRLGAGNAFGDLSLMGSRPRMASVRCLEETHFAVLSKQDFNNVLGQIERKKMNEKIQFLRSLPFFSALTKTSIGKLTYQFKDVNLIKN